MGREASAVIALLRNVCSSVNITTAAWVQLSAGIGSDASAIQINNSSTSTLKLGYGATGAEQDLLLIPASSVMPLLPCILNKGMPIQIKALSGTASAGEVLINILG